MSNVFADLQKRAVEAELGVTLTPLEGGYHVKALPDGLCVDVMRMIFNWRIVRSDDQHHIGYDRGWCYRGTGTSTLRLAVSQALAWDGADDTEPEGWIKRLIDVPGKGEAGYA